MWALAGVGAGACTRTFVRVCEGAQLYHLYVRMGVRLRGRAAGRMCVRM